jgi:multisubunit Na+/H+ antiporter MnhC subunit
MKKLKNWRKELTDPHFILFSLTGIFLIGSGLFLFLSGDMAKTLSGLALWSYGLIALGFSLGFNFGKYGE